MRERGCLEVVGVGLTVVEKGMENRHYFVRTHFIVKVIPISMKEFGEIRRGVGVVDGSMGNLTSFFIFLLV